MNMLGTMIDAMETYHEYLTVVAYGADSQGKEELCLTILAIREDYEKQINELKFIHSLTSSFDNNVN